MPASNNIGDVLFFTGIGVGAVAWFLLIPELIAIVRFVPWVFRYGPRAVQRSVTLQPPAWPSVGPNKIEMQYGYARVLGPTECLFRGQGGRIGGGITWPPKGIIRWQGIQAHIECRWSIAAVAFIGAWVLAWTGGGVAILLSSGNLFGLVVLLFGWVFGVGIYRFNTRRTREWVEAMIAEFDSVFARAAA